MAAPLRTGAISGLSRYGLAIERTGSGSTAGASVYRLVESAGAE
ncbi:MAG: hypothetical protein AAFP23_08720 [Pseudomonadota bacterium]